MNVTIGIRATPAGKLMKVRTIGISRLKELLAGGIDPNYVGELVREGIEGDWDYIFTDAQFEPNIDARFANIKAGFDRIRDRVPAR